MNNFAESISLIIMGLLTIALGSVIGGTLLYLLWEGSIPAMFPKAVESGVLAATLTWWQCVKITWVSAILIKSTTTINKK